MFRLPFLALILVSLLPFPSAKAMDDPNMNSGGARASVLKKKKPSAAKPDHSSAPSKDNKEPVGSKVNAFYKFTPEYLKAEALYRGWEKSARSHDLTRFITAISLSSLDDGEKIQILGPVALLMGKPENISFVGVKSKISASLVGKLEKELGEFEGNIGITAGMAVRFWMLTLPERIKYVKAGYPEFKD